MDPAKRVVINELVCEGCGDCSVQSNCLSVEPLETEFGRKRQINQSTCNKDYSCVKGFCPSFVTVEGGQLKKKAKGKGPSPFDLATLPEPVLPSLAGVEGQVWGIVVAGVGGTGVITIGQLLGVAAHLEGKGIVTQDAGGLAQKGGATWSHVLIGASQDDIRTTRVSMAAADLIIGCDPIVAAAKDTVMRMRAGRTHVALNSHATPTAAFVTNANWVNPSDACVSAVVRAVGLAAVGAFNADAAAVQLMGDSIYTNPMLLSYAWQRGWIPLGKVALLRAIELNAVAIEQNKTAFEWGRRAAHDAGAFDKLLNPGQVVAFTKRSSLDELIAKRVEFLTAYQNAAYAADYQAYVQKVRQVDESVGGKNLALRRRWRATCSSSWPTRTSMKWRVCIPTRLPRQNQRPVRGGFQAELPPRAAPAGQKEQQGRVAEAAVWPGDVDGFQGAGPAQGPARNATRYFWLYRGAPRGTCVDHRVPRQPRRNSQHAGQRAR